MHLNQWLESVADEERAKTAGLDLERVYDQLEPEELLKIATGEADLAEVLEKRAGSMSQERREDLPSKAFAVPESKAKKIGVESEIQGEAKGKYPIPDLKHARNALARVSQFGTPAEREAVRKKVYSKYPELREGFEESHGGESPTSKENVKKEEQGGVGKSAMAKLAFFDQIARQVAHVHADMEKGAGIMRPEQPTAKELIQGRGPKARAARTALREKMRAECPVGQEIDKQLGLTKEDEFVTPEAKTKAKVMRTALRATKGAPTNVRKAAVKQVGQKIASVQSDSPYWDE